MELYDLMTIVIIIALIVFVVSFVVTEFLVINLWYKAVYGISPIEHFREKTYVTLEFFEENGTLSKRPLMIVFSTNSSINRVKRLHFDWKAETNEGKVRVKLMKSAFPYTVEVYIKGPQYKVDEEKGVVYENKWFYEPVMTIKLNLTGEMRFLKRDTIRVVIPDVPNQEWVFLCDLDHFFRATLSYDWGGGYYPPEPFIHVNVNTGGVSLIGGGEP